jgi:hypothetical protein
MPEIDDPVLVYVHSPENVSSACRLCLWRNLPGESLVVVGIQGRRPTCYCAVCYEHLRELGRDCLPELMPKVSPGSEVWLGYLPEIQIKDDDPLRLFWPEPEIDLPLWRQQVDGIRSRRGEDRGF